eukprot:gnl/TRDRNA2_/TRDRNA2_165252_c3_seq2.p1 gnl/TRDRNA2_/TRDRNA2_165252_c3~~gnl/TRDRNA2_/TRDRNA2_165252_c3_seq2.p1  ORF type:complete len:215 (+),score=39.91 gnl/TRDRNA2_/TRDRNA2_165252_c3_seq2:61-705(+)
MFLRLYSRKAYFTTLGLDVTQARALFVLLDVDETDEVEIEEFVMGCMRLKGEAKSIDVNMLLYENEKLLCSLTNFVEYCQDKFGRLEVALGINPLTARHNQKRRKSTTSANPDHTLSRLENGLNVLANCSDTLETELPAVLDVTDNQSSSGHHNRNGGNGGNHLALMDGVAKKQNGLAEPRLENGQQLTASFGLGRFAAQRAGAKAAKPERPQR